MRQGKTVGFRRMQRFLNASLVVSFGSVLLIACGIFTTRAAQAAPADTQITMSPPSTRVALNPGDTHRGTFTVVNTGKKAFDFMVYAKPYQVTDEVYTPTFDKTTPQTQIARWVSFEKTQYHLEPSGEMSVPYTIAVPVDAPGGGQFAVLFAQTTAAADAKTPGVMSKKRVGMLLYSTVNGETHQSGEVPPVIASWWQANAPLAAKQPVRNTGNTDFVADTKLTVTDLFGKEVYQESKPYAVLPGTTRAIAMEWDEAPAIGIFKATSEVGFFGQTHVSSYWVVMISPLTTIGTVVLLAVIVGGTIYWIRRRRPRITYHK